ncbi:MAG TPA: FtsX-like permease family protein, partial [Verrucomicrobiae bacterium]|nr:FtsX-like permease family protein [Verrucomicrobiae bacterium]
MNERIVTLEVAGIIPAAAEGPQAPATLLVMDLPALQSLAGRTGFLSRIEFIVEEGPQADERRRALRGDLEQWSGGRWTVSSPTDRRESAATMTRAFRVNLTILSLIALLVGLYLIFQALDGAVVRRREEIGILRSLGVEERIIRRAWLLEAALLGLVGGGLGALLGWAGAQFSVRLVGRTVNALYYSTSVDHARLDGVEMVAALVLAVATSLLAGWLPARAAARTPPAQILVRHALAPPGLQFWRKEWLGAVIALVGFGLIMLPPLRFEGGVRFPLAGYLAGLCWIIGGGILSGGTLRLLAGGLRPLGRWLIPVKIAAGHLVQPSGRHRLAVAGLVCAIAMTAGMTILVASFDTTMRGWIERTFQADLYVSSSGAQSASTENRISAATWKTLAGDPAVEAINVVQTSEVRLSEGATILSGGELGLMHQRTSLPWVQEPLSDEVFAPEKNAGLALVSESFSERFQLRRGDHVT